MTDTFNITDVVDEAANRWGKAIALHHVESGRSTTFEEVRAAVNRIGSGLSRLGIEIENRVALLLDDSFEFAHAVLGALKAGATVAPMNPLLSAAEWEHLLDDCRAKVVFVGEPYLEKLRPVRRSLEHLRHVVVCGEGATRREDGELAYADLLAAGSERFDAAPTSPNDVALFAYTSGSTGRPRAIMHAHRPWSSGMAPLFSEVYGLRRGESHFHVAKLYFLSSLGALCYAFMGGAPMVLLSGRPSPEVVFDVVTRFRPVFLAGPPTIFARMAQAARDAGRSPDLSFVRYVFCTGEALPPTVYTRFKEAFGLELYNDWGTQEVASAPLSWPCGAAVPPEKVGSCGKWVIPGAEVRIVDDARREVAPGTPGLLEIRIGSRFIGYWREFEEAAGKGFGEWYRPGDWFLRDEDGYYWYLGRASDMVKVGGRQVFPAEVEQALAQHPAVLECAVVDVKDAYGLAELKAFVVPKEGSAPSVALASELQEIVKSFLAPYKRPRHIAFVTELPRTATGKIQRFQLRDKTETPGGTAP